MIPDSLPSLPIKPGDVVLGKYRVERTLGEGGMGIVLAIRHAELDELFAMKLMKPGVAKQPDVVDKLDKLGLTAAPSTADEMARRMAADKAAWNPIIKNSGFQLD